MVDMVVTGGCWSGVVGEEVVDGGGDREEVNGRRALVVCQDLGVKEVRTPSGDVPLTTSQC